MKRQTDNPVYGVPRHHRYRLAAVLLLALCGLVLVVWQPISADALLAWGRELSSRPSTALLLVLLQALLLAFGLPGTLMLWVIAPLYPLVTAAGLLTIGSVVGAAAAYTVARWAGPAWMSGPRGRRLSGLLADRGDFLTQLILRLLPGFPHSVLNFGAGLLGLPLRPFLVAAAIGLFVKWLVYSAAVGALIAAGAEGEPVGVEALVALLLMSALLTAGALYRRKTAAAVQ